MTHLALQNNGMTIRSGAKPLDLSGAIRPLKQLEHPCKAWLKVELWFCKKLWAGYAKHQFHRPLSQCSRICGARVSGSVHRFSPFCPTFETWTLHIGLKHQAVLQKSQQHKHCNWYESSQPSLPHCSEKQPRHCGISCQAEGATIELSKLKPRSNKCGCTATTGNTSSEIPLGERRSESRADSWLRSGGFEIYRSHFPWGAVLVGSRVPWVPARIQVSILRASWRHGSRTWIVGWQEAYILQHLGQTKAVLAWGLGIYGFMNTCYVNFLAKCSWWRQQHTFAAISQRHWALGFELAAHPSSCFAAGSFDAG